MEIIGTIIGWIITGWNAISDAVVAGLVFFYHLLRDFAGLVWDAAKFTWTDILKPVGAWLDRMYQRVRAFYDKIFGPIHAWLKRVSTLLRDIYKTYFKPVLDIIDNARRVLKLLELFHIEWAKKLDDELGALEQKIVEPLQKAIQFVNYLDSRISSYVLTVDNLFQRVTMLKSITRDVNAIANMQWNAALWRVDLNKKYRQIKPPAGKSTDDVAAAFDALVTAPLDQPYGPTADLEAAFGLLLSEGQSAS